MKHSNNNNKSKKSAVNASNKRPLSQSNNNKTRVDVVKASVLFGSIKIHGFVATHDENDDELLSLNTLEQYGILEMRTDHVQKPQILGSKQEMIQLLKKRLTRINRTTVGTDDEVSVMISEDEIPKNVTSIVAVVYFESMDSLSKNTAIIESSSLSSKRRKSSVDEAETAVASENEYAVLEWIRKLRKLDQKSSIPSAAAAEKTSQKNEKRKNHEKSDENENEENRTVKMEFESIVDGLKKVTVPHSSKDLSQLSMIGQDGKIVPCISYDEATLQVFDQCVSRAQKHSTLFITGVQKTGKSTIARFMCNRLMSIYGGVVLLDLDPTNPEFMTPGILSLSVLRKPLLGPSFANLLDRNGVSIEKSLFYGHDTAESDIDYYVNCCIDLYSHYHEHYRSSKKNCFPLVILSGNTLRVPAFESTLELIRLIQPNFVLKVQDGLSRNENREYLDSANGIINMNSLYPSSSDIISHYSFNVRGPNPFLPKKQFAEVVSILSVVAPRQVVTRSKEENSLSQQNQYVNQYLSYFGKAMPSSDMTKLMSSSDFGWTSVQQFFSHLPYYKVSWNLFTIAISNDLHKYSTKDQEKLLSQSMYQLNGSLVGLCHINQTPSKSSSNRDKSLPTFMTKYPEKSNCLGIGYVRHICPHEKKFYLITNIEANKLQQVNCILSGSITLSYLFVRQIKSKDTATPDKPFFVSSVSELENKSLTEKVNTQETALRNKQKKQNKKTKIR